MLAAQHLKLPIHKSSSTKNEILQLLLTIFFIIKICGCDDIDDNFEQYPETKELKSKYDFIIVGGGSAGCALANRLSEISAWDILLIEAGGEEIKKHMDIPKRALENQRSKIDWSFKTEPSITASLSLKNRANLIPRGKVIGGSSVLNYMVYNRGPPGDYNRWEYVYGNPGWSFKDVEKYFQKLEDYVGIDNDVLPGYFGQKGPVHVEYSNYQSNLSEAFINAAKESGSPLTLINAPMQIGVGRVPMTIKDGYRFSANRAYLVPIRRGNLHLKLHCQVVKILIENNTANGVNFACTDQNYTIYTNKEVILSAGAIKSPQLLMLSGIGPKDHLAEHGISLVKDLPVGNNLNDHVGVIGLQFTINQPSFSDIDVENQESLILNKKTGPLSQLPTEAIIFSHPSEEIQMNENIFFSSEFNELFCGNFHLSNETCNEVFQLNATNHVFNIFPLLLKPKSRGYIRLRDNRPFSHPRIYLNFFSNPDDIYQLLAGVKDALKISKKPSLKTYNPYLGKNNLQPCEKYDFESDNYWICQIRHLSVSFYHLCGTCKMGPQNSSSAVVDNKLRVHGVNGLRVIDASIMPEIVAAHINGPTIMIAEKGADMIKQYWKDAKLTTGTYQPGYNKYN